MIFFSEKQSQVYSIYEWEDVPRTQMMLKRLLNQQTKHADQQSDDRHDRKINEGQTTRNIVNFYLFFQLLVQSFQQIHKIN